MLHYYRQEKIINKPFYIPLSNEINWEMFIQDKNERELTKEIYENIGKIDEYMMNKPNIPEKIYENVYFISKYGVKDKYLIYEKPFGFYNITPVICIACGLLFFYGKIFIEYYL